MIVWIEVYPEAKERNIRTGLALYPQVHQIMFHVLGTSFERGMVRLETSIPNLGLTRFDGYFQSAFTIRVPSLTLREWKL